MALFQLRFLSLVGGAAVVALVLTGASSLPVNANSPRAFGVPSQRAYPAGSRNAATRPRRDSGTPVSCTGGATGHDAFVGGAGGNSAGGDNSGVLSGFGNEACGEGAGIGTGGTIAAGNGEPCCGYNSAGGEDSFVAAGDLNFTYGFGSFIGSGGTIEATSLGITGQSETYGNIVYAEDAFVGAGDLNRIGSNGGGSFIGGGGFSYASTQTGGKYPVSAGNEIAAVDSFIGAGDLNVVDANDSAVGGGQSNSIASPSPYSVIAGGYGNSIASPAPYSAIAGGYENHNLAGSYAFVGAGDQNAMSGLDAFIGAGESNTVTTGGKYAAVAGGYENQASDAYATVGGGSGNSASGQYGTIPGGSGNTAGGFLTFAAGYHADAKYSGSFVWSDYVSGSSTVSDTEKNEFVVRASGGVTLYSSEAATSGVSLHAGSGTWSSLSDRNAKIDIVPLDDDSILAKVAALPIDRWSYKSEQGVRHVGPMAQDFYAAFGTGEDDRHITSIDEDGVALAAIKALHRENTELRSRLATLEAQVAALASARTRPETTF